MSMNCFLLGLQVTTGRVAVLFDRYGQEDTAKALRAVVEHLKGIEQNWRQKHARG